MDNLTNPSLLKSCTNRRWQMWWLWWKVTDVMIVV